MLGPTRTTPIAAALAALMLAACGGEENVEPAEDGATAASTFGQDKDFGERVIDEETRYLVEELGLWTEVIPEDEPAAVFSIQHVDMDLACPEGVQPENDRFIGLQIEVETNPDMEELGLDQLPMAAEDFQVRLLDGGVTGGLLGNGEDCLPEDEELPDAVGPGEQVSGTVVLDVPEDIEAIVLDGVRYQMAEGWMWPLP